MHVQSRILNIFFLAPLLSVVACGGADHPAGTTSTTGSVGGSTSSEAGTGGSGGNGVGGMMLTATTTTTTGATGTGGMLGEMYPAPHPPAPQIVSLGGPVLSAPKVYPIYFGNDDPTFTAKITDFYDKIGASAYWTAVTEEYGVGPAMSSAPIQLTDSAPSSLSDSQIQAWLAGKLNANTPGFPVVDDSTVFALIYPAGTDVVVDGGGTMLKGCEDFGGYHSEMTLDGAHGFAHVPYMVMPRCSDLAGLTGIDAVTATASHELIETATDPLVETNPAYAQPDNAHIYWALALHGGEVSDMCQPYIEAFGLDPTVGYVVQRSWSNKAAAAGHDPCVPATPGQPYFNSAPVLPDMIDIGGGGPPFHVQGVKIPVGQSKTIEIDLFSDAEKPDPWFVAGLDLSSAFGGPELLKFGAPSMGKNGDKLQMTIDVVKQSPNGVELFAVTSFDPVTKTLRLWFGLVGN